MEHRIESQTNAFRVGGQAELRGHLKTDVLQKEISKKSQSRHAKVILNPTLERMEKWVFCNGFGRLLPCCSVSCPLHAGLLCVFQPRRKRNSVCTMQPGCIVSSICIAVKLGRSNNYQAQSKFSLQVVLLPYYLRRKEDYPYLSRPSGVLLLGRKED